MVDYWGAAAIDAIENFEKCEKQGVRIHTFRALSAISDPTYMEDVLTVRKSKKPSVGVFNAAVQKGAKKQWYSWHVLHRDLVVHPD